MQANNAPPDFVEEELSGSDADEDAEAKAERLRIAAERESRALQSGPSKGSSSSSAWLAPAFGGQSEEPQTARAKNGNQAALHTEEQGALQRVAARQQSMRGRAELLTGSGRKGSKAAASRPTEPARISIGPSSKADTPAKPHKEPLEDEAGEATLDQSEPSRLVTVAEPAILEDREGSEREDEELSTSFPAQSLPLSDQIRSSTCEHS